MNNRIRQLRRDKKISIAELARLAGTSKAQILKLERSERRLSLEWMQRIAKPLGVRVADLLPVEEAPQLSDSSERELLDIISHMNPSEKLALVRIAKELLAVIEEKSVKARS